MAEKIKVSILVDKDVIKKYAFSISETPNEYKQIEEIIDKKNELVRDNTEEKDEKKMEGSNGIFKRIALDIILSDNKDLEMAKRAEAAKDENDSYDDAHVKCIKVGCMDAKAVLDALIKAIRKED